MTRVVYLHGFASGPNSNKATYFKSKLAALGIEVEIPQLDGGDFENLTITGQLAVIGGVVGGRPAFLMGSSLGGYLAALYAARHREVERLVLMAPGFQFPSRWRLRYTPAQLADWKSRGSVPVFHYAYGEERMLGYRFLEDSAGYEDEPEFSQPALIFHGTRDPVVPVEVSEAFVARHPNATLHCLDSGHELTDVLDPMWERTRLFVGRVC